MPFSLNIVGIVPIIGIWKNSFASLRSLIEWSKYSLKIIIPIPPATPKRSPNKIILALLGLTGFVGTLAGSTILNFSFRSSA